MTSPTVPGPLSRLVRNRLALVGVVVLAVFAAGAGYMRDAAALQLQGSVDANWRGAFDLLVRPAGQRLNLEETAGLVEPNYLTFSGDGGITLDELAAIRSVPGVDVAAPVAMIGNMRYVVGGPVVGITDLPEQATLYQVTVRAETSDGIRDVLVQEQTGRVLLGFADPSAPSLPFITDFRSASGNEDGFFISLDSLPAISSPIIGVDPTAERQLLGPTADFLAPLKEISALQSQPIAREFDLSLIPPAFEDQRLFVEMLTLDPTQSSAERPVIPVAVSSSIYAPLTITLEVRQVGEPISEYPAGDDVAEQLAQAAEQAGDGLGEPQASVMDASEALRPFQPPRLLVVWPDSEPPLGSAASVGVADDLTAELAGRPRYTSRAARDGQTIAFSVAPQGWVDSSGTPREPHEAQTGILGSVRLGLEPAYRNSRPAALPLLEGFVPTGPLDRPFVFAPLAEFDLDRLELPDNPLNYVPLGAYAAPETRFIAGPDGEAVEPVWMTSTLNPLGLITIPPLAITDLRSATVLRGEAPIDAIRIRVAGIDRFDEAAVARVERVGSAIASMGFDVDIVAGSSPQSVEVRIPDQGVDGPPATAGWVEQGWTTLGAAERTVRGLSSTNWGLLWLSGLTAVAFAAGMLLLQRSVRSSEISVLTALGWSRWRIARWMLGEAAWAGGIVLGTGLLGWWVAGRSGWLGLAATAALAIVFPLVSATAAWTALRSGPRLSAVQGGDVDHRVAQLLPLVRKPAGYGLRGAVARPLRTLVIALALGVAAAASAAGIVVLSNTAAMVGPTRLAEALAQLLNPLQTGMLISAIAGSAVLAMTLLRMDIRSRRDETRVLLACGWDRRNLRAMLAVNRLAIGVPAALVAAAIAWLLTLAILGQRDLVAVGIGSVAVIGALMMEARWATQ